MQSTMAIMEEKHARWQERLRAQLNECTCEVTRYLLHPATQLDAVETALFLSRLQPAHLVMIKPSLRRVVVRFQGRASTLGLTLDVLPKLLKRSREWTRRPSPLGR